MIIPISETKKGHRVWVQALESKGVTGSHYDISVGDDAITIIVRPTGKRKVTQAKGGIISSESKKITQWARGATQAHAEFTGDSLITITRLEA